jgi:His-Xaa-Ser system radical SAM maturase HxsB
VAGRSLPLSPPELAADSLGYFRWGQIAGKVLVTNDAGDWAFLSEAEHLDLLAGRIADGHPRFAELRGKGFLRDGLDLDALAGKIAQRNRHLRYGPRVHVVTLTSRGKRPGLGGDTGERSAVDMSAETAEKVVDLALQSTSPAVHFDLQADGGEPLLNFPVLRHLVEVARSRSQRSVGKALTFRVLSNFTALTEEAAEWLIGNDVSVSTSLDGPASVHDWNRKWKGGSPHADVVRWIEYFMRRYTELGRDPQHRRVDALITVTRRTLEAWREVVDEYVARGVQTIHLRPLDRSRVDATTWSTVGYSLDEYLAFYRRALDYIVELNRRGTELQERMASIFLTKILTSEDAGVVDIQSPNGAGSGQIAYDVDGRIFPSDEARLIDVMGDSFFELGNVGSTTIGELQRHPTVRAIAAASLLDSQPQCADCWNKPFCGFSPVRNFATQGDLIGQRPHCVECKEHMAVSTRLFELLADEASAETTEILKRWTLTGPQRTSGGRASLEAP